MRQQTFQKALSRMTETGVRLFFAACLLFALLTAIYNIWLCLAELVLILLLYLFFQTGISRRKKEVMAYLDHMTSGVDVASRRTLISSPSPSPSSGRTPMTSSGAMNAFSTSPATPTTFLRPSSPPWCPPSSPSGCWMETTSAPNPFPWATSCTWFSAIWSVPGTGRIPGHHLLGGCHRVRPGGGTI